LRLLLRRVGQVQLRACSRGQQPPPQGHNPCHQQPHARFDPLAGLALVGLICQLGGFRFSVSICQPAVRRTGHCRHLACNLRMRRPLASTFLRQCGGCVD